MCRDIETKLMESVFACVSIDKWPLYDKYPTLPDGIDPLPFTIQLCSCIIRPCTSEVAGRDLPSDTEGVFFGHLVSCFGYDRP